METDNLNIFFISMKYHPLLTYPNKDLIGESMKVKKKISLSRMISERANSIIMLNRAFSLMKSSSSN